MIKAPITDARLLAREIEQQKAFFPTRFKFLAEINGLRPGFLTGILGTTGCGKSTLMKSIVVDTVTVEKCLVWLSEESAEDYSIGISKVDKDYNKENILFFEEISMSIEDRKKHFKTVEDSFNFLKGKVFETGAKVLFLDNLTTSSIYSGQRPENQTLFISMLNAFAGEYRLTVLYMAHTEASINEGHLKLIEGENIRGSKQPFQQSAYFFIMQRFRVENKYFSFIRIRKHRFTHNLLTLNFELIYDNGKYIEDKKSTFEMVNAAFKLRDYLDRKKIETKTREVKNDKFAWRDN